MQAARLETLRRDEAKLFLVGHSAAAGKQKFTVCNTTHPEKPLTVTIGAAAGGGSKIGCNCSDFRFRCAKNKIVCKHCIFILVNGFSLNLDAHICEGHIVGIGGEELAAKISALAGRVTPAPLAADFSTDRGRALSQGDSCPICLDDFAGAAAATLVACPDCRNQIHAECMRIWLVANSTCVFCRSDVWRRMK